MGQRVTVASALGLAAAALVVRGCSPGLPANVSPGDASAVSADPQDGQADVPSAAQIRDVNEAEAGNEYADAAQVPDGWVRWDGYGAGCGFYVPASASNLPLPFQWTACDASAQPAGAACRQMLVDWPPWSDGNGISSWVSAYADPSGNLSLQVSRLTGASVFRLIGAADGNLTQAIVETNPGACTLGQSSLGPGVYAYRVFENNSDLGNGALAGNPANLSPAVLLHSPDKLSHAYIAGAPGILDTVKMRLYAVGSAQPFLTIGDPADGALAYYEHQFVGPSLVWEASSQVVSKLKVWTLPQGARDLVSFGTDTTQGAGDVGADGRDLVWLYGSGRTAGSVAPYPTMSIMTSPFTTDPAQVTPRRLRSELATGFTTSPFVVGCGYAARANGAGFRLVRLSDGVSWYFPADPALLWRWVIPVALTCSEVFGTAEVRSDAGARPTIAFARVRLDSLGAGDPPD